MGLQIGKKGQAVAEQEQKPVGKAKPTAKVKQLTETQKMVDELVTINYQLDQLEVAKMQKRQAELKAQLQSIANESNHDKEVKFTGTKGEVIFSACREETNITDRDAMIKALTPEVFVAVGKVNLTDIKKYLSAGEIAGFTEKVYGARSLKHSEFYQ